VTFSKEGNKKVFPFERTVYRIKWEKVISLFEKRFEGKLEEKNEEFKKLELDSKNFNKQLIDRGLEDNKLNLKNNKYIKDYLNSMFAELHRVRDKSNTLNNVFDYIIDFGLDNLPKNLKSMNEMFILASRSPSLFYATKITQKEVKKPVSE
jgi:hypothetical protein